MRTAWLITSRDLMLEARTKQLLNSVAPFAAALLVVFGLAFGGSRAESERSAPIVLWVVLLLSSLFTVKRAFDIEYEDGAFEGLRLSPADRAAVFFGKAGAVAVQLMLLGILTLAGIVVLFSIEAVEALSVLVLSLLLGCVGLSAVATLFAALVARTPGTDSLLPLLVFPVVIPVLLAGVRTTQLAFQPDAPAGPWLGMMAAFAAISAAGSALVFEQLVED